MHSIFFCKCCYNTKKQGMKFFVTSYPVLVNFLLLYSKEDLLVIF